MFVCLIKYIRFEMIIIVRDKRFENCVVIRFGDFIKYIKCGNFLDLMVN